MQRDVLLTSRPTFYSAILSLATHHLRPIFRSKYSPRKERFQQVIECHTELKKFSRADCKTNAYKNQTHLSRQHRVYSRAWVQIEFPKHFESVY